MAAANTPMELPKKAQEGVIAFLYQAYSLMMQQYNIREQMRQVDLAYIRENDLTRENWRGRISNAWGDADRYQNITVPVVKPQVETSVTYQASVFLTGTPLFGCVAGPQFIDEALQMETVVDENAIRGAWKRELMLMFRDGFKYNICASEIAWEREITYALDTDITFADGKQGKPKEVIWEGNVLRRMDMYNTFFDTRVHPTRIHTHGEFVGYDQLMGRIALKKFIAELPDKMISNVNAAFESGFGGWGNGGLIGGVQNYYIPPINPAALINKNMYATNDWMMWAGLVDTAGGKIKYQNLYQVTVLYARILPADFGIRTPAPNTPQVWKFIIVNHQVVIYAERQTNAHGWLPIIFSQPNEDGLAYQTKSLADDMIPLQSVSSALLNSVIASRRRAISDRTLYDPSRVSADQINSANPSAKIPVRPAAYGTEISKSVYAFPYRDDQSSIALGEIQTIGNMGDYIAGHNKAQQGQFVKGNKTRHEYENVMQHASGRDQLCSILLEDQFFSPMKLILKSNILQYQGGVSYYNRAEQRNVQIDPVKLRQAIFEFKISDGLIPADKLIGADVASVALQQIGSSQILSRKYDSSQLFSYIMKTQGADLREYEKSKEQVAYEEAMGAWSAQGDRMMETLKTLSPIAAKDTPIVQLMEMIKGMIPPQPKPADFGWNPKPEANNGNPTSK